LAAPQTIRTQQNVFLYGMLSNSRPASTEANALYHQATGWCRESIELIASEIAISYAHGEGYKKRAKQISVRRCEAPYFWPSQGFRVACQANSLTSGNFLTYKSMSLILLLGVK